MYPGIDRLGFLDMQNFEAVDLHNFDFSLGRGLHDGITGIGPEACSDFSGCIHESHLKGTAEKYFRHEPPFDLPGSPNHHPPFHLVLNQIAGPFSRRNRYASGHHKP